MSETIKNISMTREKNSEKVIGTDVCSFTDRVCIGKDCRVCDVNAHFRIARGGLTDGHNKTELFG